MTSGVDWDFVSAPLYCARRDELRTWYRIKLNTERPDKPLVVKCEYNTRRQKLIFKSARFCTYDGLKDQVLPLLVHFAIQWKDQDGELNYIYSEDALNEAIDYYQSGDEMSVASSSSVFLSRSSSRHHRITMLVQIVVDYDGPSLSDTASLASTEDPFEGSKDSFSAGELSSPPQDDDAVTVSSKDTRSQGRTDSSLLKKFLNGASRSTCSSSQSRSLPKRILRSRVTSTEEESTQNGTQDMRTNLADTERAYPDDPSAVLERLKLEDRQGPSLSHEHSKAWLREQNTLRVKATSHAPSISDDFSLNTDTPFSDGDPDILLQKNEHGRYFYSYTGSGSSESTEDPEYEVVNSGQPSNCAGIPHELLVPEEVTDCSECGEILDQFKYICTTCGEKTPTSRGELAHAADSLPSSRASQPSHVLHPLEQSQRLHALLLEAFTRLTIHIAYTNGIRQKPWLSIDVSSTKLHGSSSSSTRAGYELCPTCLEKVGLDHSLGSVGSPSSPTFPHTAEERSIARRTAPRRKGQLRHAFLEQMWGFNGWQDIEQDDISHHCSGCQSVLSGTRSRFLEVSIYNNVGLSDVHNIHPVHPFLEKRVKPASRSHNPHEPDDAGAYENVDESSLKHLGVQCFNCEQDIVGARFHCIDCTTTDIDICSNCETAGLPGNLEQCDGGHSSSHIMLKIPVPLDMHQVQHVSRRAHGLSHSRDSANLRRVSPRMRSSPGSVSSISAGTVLYGSGVSEEIEEDYVHLQVCNSCSEPIIGIRYQCLNCPSLPYSYNLCSDCELKSYDVHNPMHMFLKIPRPVDIPAPLESEFPIIPVLYRSPAGPPPGTDASGDPGAYLQNLTHTIALCDRHMKRIVGKWYRCAFCPTDLCADCEEVDTHDRTHVFLVFKAPVDTEAFRWALSSYHS
ncbi:hypothetical protein BGW80DRAFT_1457279 [Lactifluus volemus]|nr:hypothetical protein BGW80DRAFT_1457279 [Lactifluus volemus]